MLLCYEVTRSALMTVEIETPLVRTSAQRSPALHRAAPA